MSASPLVELRRVSKSFGGVRAVSEVDLELHAGEVLAVLGHNGAGKSTLMKILSGVAAADSGEIRVGGKGLRMRSPRDARQRGIETLYQDLALADNLDATANLFLGRELRTRWGTLDDHAMQGIARRVIQDLNPRFQELEIPVRRLSGGQRQTVAIARAIHFEARVLILDEPTAALGPAETRSVQDLVRRLREAGLGVFLVSHDLEEVLGVADRIAVMRAGQLVGVVPAAGLDRDALVAMIVGAALPSV